MLSKRSANHTTGRRQRSRALVVGERVMLRRIAASDRDAWISLRKRNRVFLKKWEPRPTPDSPADPFCAAAFAQTLRLGRNRRNLKMVICRRDTGAIIGSLNFNGIVRGPLQSTTMGYWIDRRHARMGYMTEAIRLALRYAFETMKLHRVEANIMPWNKPSLGLIRNCGFRREGMAKGLVQIDGRWCDHVRWAITVEEWEHE
jgi:ribosomal-protein-alanine N-acetyltransferase